MFKLKADNNTLVWGLGLYFRNSTGSEIKYGVSRVKNQKVKVYYNKSD